MEAVFVIPIVRLGQYVTKSASFFLVLTDFDPTNTGVPDTLQILHA